MLGKSLAILVVSPRERSGTTLIARLFAEFFRMAGSAPLVFDTDAARPRLSKYFPEAELADLASTKGQMRLFDTLPVPSHEPKIVDVSARAFPDFFRLMRDIDLIAEARANNVEPVIVYVPHYEAEDFERGFRIREHFRCEFVLAENAQLGPAPQSLHSVNAYWALKANPARFQLRCSIQSASTCSRTSAFRSLSSCASQCRAISRPRANSRSFRSLICRSMRVRKSEVG
jgi:hypothetical protein